MFTDGRWSGVGRDYAVLVRRERVGTIPDRTALIEDSELSSVVYCSSVV